MTPLVMARQPCSLPWLWPPATCRGGCKHRHRRQEVLSFLQNIIDRSVSKIRISI